MPLTPELSGQCAEAVREVLRLSGNRHVNFALLMHQNDGPVLTMTLTGKNSHDWVKAFRQAIDSIEKNHFEDAPVQSFKDEEVH